MSNDRTVWLPPAGADPSFEPVATEGAPPVYAGFGRRAGAYLLDLVVQLAFAVVVGVAVALIAFDGAAPDEDADVETWLDVSSYVVTAASSVLYYMLLMRRAGARNGQTWGRQAAGVRVVRDDGRPVTAGFAAWRDYVVKGVLTAITLGIDLLWPLWERENRTLHDLLLHTHVIAVERS
jgi:uncharacterized RDD family membrane protein YckC